MRGEVAPFSGQLLTPALALDLTQKVDATRTKCALEKDKLKEFNIISENLVKELWAQESAANEMKIKLLTDRLKEAKNLQKAPWYERPTFVAIATVIATSAVFAGAIKYLEAVE